MKFSLITFFALSILFPFSLNGQELQELNVKESTPANVVPVFRDFPEHAAIIIESNLTNLSFESNVGIIDDKSDPSSGIYRLLIHTWRQTITASSQGYKQARFSIPASQARDVHYYTITPVESEDTELIYVRFIIEPDDATLLVNNQEVDYSGAVQLEAGAKQIRIIRDGMKTITDEVTVDNKDNNFFEYTLESIEREIVTISTKPENVTIAIDEIEQDKDKNQFFLYPGDYVIRLSKKNYKALETQIVVTDGKDNQFEFELPSFAGTLELNVTPEDAQTFVNKQDFTGQSSIILTPERHLLEIHKDGYKTHEERFVLEDNQTLSKKIELIPLTGDLLFGITPSSANVELFNPAGELVEKWQGLKKIENLPVGEYRFNAEHSQYEPLSGTIKIEEDERVMKEFKMEQHNLLSEFIERSETEFNSQHILIKLPANPTPNDTTEVYRKLLDARQEWLNGAEFENLNRNYSSFKAGRPMGGEIGYVSAGQLVKPYEDRGYNLPIDSISMPFKTQFGYHIIKVLDRQPKKAERLISHIFIPPSPTRSEKNIDSLVNKLGMMIYNKLQTGEIDWPEAVSRYSKDSNSSEANGVIGFTRQGQYNEVMSDSIFNIEKVGYYTRPFYSGYGMHIIRLDSIRTYTSEKQKREELLKELKKLPRYKNNN
jgi:parvulin-like peptidyl-prolyl isomerase